MRHTATLLAFSLLAGVACKRASGDAKLTIEGQNQLALDPGDTIELRVRYTDLDNDALGGQVEFSLSHSGVGSLSAPRVDVNDYGLATVTLTVARDTDDQKQFEVYARAPDATSVAWNVRLDVNVLPANAAGTYELRSDLSIPAGAPGARTIHETLNEACDDRDDPGKFFIDLIAGEDASAQLLLSLWRPEIDNTVNDVFPDRGAAFKRDFCAAAGMIKELTRKFRLLSQLKVETAADDTLKATHSAEGFAFQNDVYYFRDLGVTVPDPVEVTLGLDEKRGILTIQEHSIVVPYGTILEAALEDTILPEVGRGIDDLVDLLERDIDCRAIGAKLAETVGNGYSTVLQLACSAGLQQIAGSLENQFTTFDTTTMTLSGEGNLRKIDTAEVRAIEGGRWRGVMQFDTSQASLHSSESTFSGERSF